jgi:hypothetical protein
MFSYILNILLVKITVLRASTLTIILVKCCPIALAVMVEKLPRNNSSVILILILIMATSITLRTSILNKLLESLKTFLSYKNKKHMLLRQGVVKPKKPFLQHRALVPKSVYHKHSAIGNNIRAVLVLVFILGSRSICNPLFLDKTINYSLTVIKIYHTYFYLIIKPYLLTMTPSIYVIRTIALYTKLLSNCSFLKCYIMALSPKIYWIPLFKQIIDMKPQIMGAIWHIETFYSLMMQQKEQQKRDTVVRMASYINLKLFNKIHTLAVYNNILAAAGILILHTFNKKFTIGSWYI